MRVPSFSGPRTRAADEMGSYELICFSTDHPHRDFDSPLEAAPVGLPDDLTRNTSAENAYATYPRLPVPGEQDSVVVCAAGELEPGGMAPALLGMLPVVAVRTLDGELHAYVDRCLHQGARLSGGRVLPHTEGDAVGEHRMLDAREVLKCPWHGDEYDVRTGCAVFDRRRALLRLDVAVEGGQIVIRPTKLSAG